MKEIGEKLKSSRESIGVTIEEVATDLKVKKEILEAIENGDKEPFKDIFYLKDLLKNYSKYLGLDYDKIVDYAHTNGIKVKTWTIVSESKLRECEDIGVDYIITELPPEPWPWKDEGQTSIIPIMAD